MTWLYKKSKIWFAVMWIVIYVVGTSAADALSAALGTEKLLTLPFLGLLTLTVLIWMHRSGLLREFGLCKPCLGPKQMLYYIPLIVLVSCNLWFGVQAQLPLPELLLYMGSMLLVGFLEELIFRGFLFQAMRRDGLRMAMIVSSLTFGIGHIVNLFNGSGAQLLANFCQVCYAVAAGFLFVIIFYKSKSLLPCIATHSLLNALSAFAPPLDDAQQILSASLLCLIPGVYILWLLRQNTPSDEEKEAAHG